MIEPYYQDEWVTLYYADCAQVLPKLGQHDLLLTDPPYGIGESNERNLSRVSKARVKDYGTFNWDRIPIVDWLIYQAIAKCKKAIIFGGNFYYLPPAKCWLVWDKDNNTSDFADCELAWTNLDKTVRLYRHRWNGMIRKGHEERFHPTQKPLDVMSWCLGQIPVTSVLDPFAGSGTTLVAAKLRNCKATGIEREKRYCDLSVIRLSQSVLNFSNTHNGEPNTITTSEPSLTFTTLL